MSSECRNHPLSWCVLRIRPHQLTPSECQNGEGTSLAPSHSVQQVRPRCTPSRTTAVATPESIFALGRQARFIRVTLRRVVYVCGVRCGQKELQPHLAGEIRRHVQQPPVAHHNRRLCAGQRNLQRETTAVSRLPAGVQPSPYTLRLSACYGCEATPAVCHAGSASTCTNASSSAICAARMPCSNAYSRSASSSARPG